MLVLAAGCVAPDDAAPAANPEVAIARVGEGDTLSAIARRIAFPGGWRALARENDLADPDRLRESIGLRVPVAYLRDRGLDPADVGLEPYDPAPAQPLVPCRAEATRGDCVEGAGVRACVTWGDEIEDMCGAEGDCDDEVDGAWERGVAPPRWIDITRGGTQTSVRVPNSGDGELAGYAVDLDGDGRDELVVVVPIELWNHSGWSFSRVLVVGEAGVGQLDVAEWGVGSLIEDDDGRCDVLATDWDELEHPLEGWGMYFVGRPLRYEHGELVPRGDEVVRRMRTRFYDADRADAVETPALWLADPSASWWHELSMHAALDHYEATVGGVEVLHGGVGIWLERDGDAEQIHLDALDGIGWAATGMRLPTGYVPAQPDGWIGARAVVNTIVYDTLDGHAEYEVWIEP